MEHTSYTSIFNVTLLDDLHNYFPDVLYNHRRFTSVQDLLQYIQDETRSRFNLLDYGRRQVATMNNNNTIATSNITVPHVSTSNIAVSTSNIAATIDPSGMTTPIRVRAAPPPLRHYTYMYETAEELRGTNFISNLFNLIQNPTNTYADVIVFPTNQQIEAATTVDTLTSTLEDACPICQEEMPAATRVRRITSCNHSFHIDCIGHWFEQSCFCPICRTDIRGGHQPSAAKPPRAASPIPPVCLKLYE